MSYFERDPWDICGRHTAEWERNGELEENIRMKLMADLKGNPTEEELEKLEAAVQSELSATRRKRANHGY